jgi:hypothetical protein
MSVFFSGEIRHRLAMSAERLLQARIALVPGLGQIVAFGSSFYLLGSLGDPIARDLGLPASAPRSPSPPRFALFTFAMTFGLRRVPTHIEEPVIA